MVRRPYGQNVRSANAPRVGLDFAKSSSLGIFCVQRNGIRNRG